MRTIAIMSHNRPKCLRTVLQSLATNNLDGWTVVIGQNNTQAAQAAVLAALTTLSGRCDLQIHVPKAFKDVRDNPYDLQKYVFEVLGSEINILLEDDTPVSNDVCDLAIEYQKLADPRLLLAYNRPGPLSDQGPLELIKKHPCFATNLAYACTPASWHNYLRRWWYDDNHGLGTHNRGYDHSLNGHSRKEQVGVYQVACSRVTHLDEDGVHTRKANNTAWQRIYTNYRPPMVEKPIKYVFEV